MTTAETKSQAIALVRTVHVEADTFFPSLPAVDLDRPVYGEGKGWTIRDLVPHLALWQSVATRVAEKIARADALPHPYLRAPGVRHPRSHLTHAQAALKEIATP